MTPIPAYLCLLLLLCSSASAQVSAPKPAGFLPEAEQWVRDHVRPWANGSELAARIAAARSLVLVAPPQSEPAQHCAKLMLAREDPLLFGVCAGWEDARALDAWLADGKGATPALLEKSTLDLARAWNADEKHAKKLRAAGIDYRATRESAVGLTEFVTRIDPQLDQRAGQLLGPFRQVGADGRNRYDRVDENWRFAVRQLLSDLHEQAAERSPEWEKVVGPAGLATGLRSLERLRQAEEEVSKPGEFRRGRALCQNAASARDELARGCGVVLFLPAIEGFERADAQSTLGAEALVVLVLQSKEDPDAAALARVQPSGFIDLGQVPRSGTLASWFDAHFGRRADLVLWAPPR